MPKKKNEKKPTVQARIFCSNTLMVLIILLLFMTVNLFILKAYWETIEHAINAHTIHFTNTNYQSSGDVEHFLQDLLLKGQHFFLFFALDGILCIAALVLVSVFFTRRLTRHIMKPLQALEDGAARMKAGNLREPVIYSGDVEFEDVCLAFNEMQTHILTEQEKNRKYEKARIDMVAGISHDLRTPLTAIRGTIKGLMDNVVTTKEERERFLQTAYHRSEDMNLLLQKLFYFSKLETGNMPVSLTRADLSEFLRQYVTAAQMLPDADFSFQTDLTEGLYCEFDALHLSRILDNLLENSIKYTDARPLKIQLSLKKEGEMLVCRFSDNGPGVPDEKLPHIFEEFYRADESRGQKKGSGLGLYVVKTLMESMHGTVSAQNQNGFQITLTFPLAEGDLNNG